MTIQKVASVHQGLEVMESTHVKVLAVLNLVDYSNIRLITNTHHRESVTSLSGQAQSD